MTQVLDIPAIEVLPEDLQEAMSRVFETARKYSDSEVHALRAALNIALQYVRMPDPAYPEIVVMWTDEDTVYEGLCWRRNDDGEYGNWPWKYVIPSNTIYLVCPHCCQRTSPTAADEGTEYRRTYTDEMQFLGGYVTYGVGDSDDFSCNVSHFMCEWCNGRSTVPDWMDGEYS
jgi:hypothetical protein